MQRERSKTGLQRWEAGSLKPFGGLHINTALKNGHCWTLSSAQGLYWTLGCVKAWSYRTLKPECGIWLITSTLLSLWGEILSPTLFLKSGTRDSPSRNLESELLKPLLLKKIENSHYFGMHDILTWGWAELWKKAFILFICRYRYLADAKNYVQTISECGTLPFTCIRAQY